MSSSDKGDYFPAQIGQVLDDRSGPVGHSTFTIIRKLGSGSRSSTWLVRNTSSKEYYAAKIYTTTASAQAERVELPILKKVNSIASKDELPTLRRTFWEKSENSSQRYLCTLFDPTSTSVLDMLQQTEEGKLPLRAVQKIVRLVALGLEGLQRVQIMHGAVKPKNICFMADSRPEVLDHTLESSLASTGKRGELPSEPIAHNFTWKGPPGNISCWGLILNGFGHAQMNQFTPDKAYDYCSAPETLLHASTCSPATDIWMLGYTAVYLLTGIEPFQAKRVPSKTMAHIFSVLSESPEALPGAWAKDRNMADFVAAAEGQTSGTLKDMLTNALPASDVEDAFMFIKACLRIDPKSRLTAKKILQHEWLKGVYYS